MIFDSSYFKKSSKKFSSKKSVRLPRTPPSSKINQTASQKEGYDMKFLIVTNTENQSQVNHYNQRR